MKKLLAVFILLSMMISGIAVPASAKAKQKTMTAGLRCESGELVKCALPYYSKWKVRKQTLETDEIIFDSSDDEISVRVLTDYDEPETGLFISGLSDKKKKDRLMKYLKEDFGDLEVSPEMFAKVYKYKNDGNGRYMLLVDLADRYSVIRPIDDKHLLVYSYETLKDEVSKTQKNRIISYAKKTAIKEIVKDAQEAELKSDRLLFSSVYSNSAWRYQKQVILVLGDGRTYSYDQSLEAKLEASIGDQIDKKILDYLISTEPLAVMDQDYLNEMYSNAVKVNPDAKYTTKHVRYDGGQTSFYFHKDDGTRVLCASDGDVTYDIDDEYAKKVAELWEDSWMHYIPSEKDKQRETGCPISLPSDKDWYVAMEGNGQDHHDYLWNSRESYSTEALSWVTTMECWFMEFSLNTKEMSFYMDLIGSSSVADREKAFTSWDSNLYPKLHTATVIFDESAELISGTAEYIGETAKGYPVIRSLFECNDHIITMYMTYNKDAGCLQVCELANGEGSRMKEDIEKYVEKAIINQQY